MFNQLFRILGLLFSYLIPFKFYDKCRHLSYRFYTGWRGKKFKRIGKSSILESNMHIVGEDMIEIGENVVIERGTAITAFSCLEYPKNSKIIIGDNSVVGPDCHITAINCIKIGQNLRTGKSVLISDNAHGDTSNPSHLNMHPNDRPLVSKGPIIIGDNVWIGEKVAIMAGVTIGNGAIIGANAVVTKDIPSGAIAVGIPAKVLNK